jgi:hypothetical protein
MGDQAGAAAALGDLVDGGGHGIWFLGGGVGTLGVLERQE